MIYSTEKYNIVIVLFVLIFFILFVNYIFDACQNKNKSEGFQNNNSNKYINQYIKFKETLGHETIRDEPYDEWNDKSLSQCLDECNNDDKCVAFVRDNIGDKEKGNCYPKKDIKHCHTLKRGNNMQRMDAINYNTYFKTSFLEKNQNLLNRCLGDQPQTLDRDIFITSSIDPNLILTFDSIIKMKKHKLKDQNFHKTAKFKIVKGLENNTVSFILIDNFEDNYYLIDNYNQDDKFRKLELSIIDESNSSFKSRSQASFYLEEGKSDKRKVSIANIFNNIKYYWILDKNKVSMVPEDYFDKSHKDHRKRMEHGTFDILNLITETSVIEGFASRPNNSSRRRISKYYNMNRMEPFINSFKDDLNKNSKDFKESTTLIDFIEIRDIKGNSIKIPTFEEIIDLEKLKNIVKKFNTDLIKNLDSKFSKYDTSLKTYNKIKDESIIRDYNKNKFSLRLKEYPDYTADEINIRDENKTSNIIGLQIAQVIIPKSKTYSVKILNYNYLYPNSNNQEEKKELSLFNKNNQIIDNSNLIKNINNYNYSRNDIILLLKKYNIDIKTNIEIKTKELWNKMVFILGSGLPNLTKEEINLLNEKIAYNLDTNNSSDNQTINKLLIKINSSIVFVTKTIYIQKNNPKVEFDEITKNTKTIFDDDDRKMRNLEQLFTRENNINGKLNQFLIEKESELEFYKKMNNQKIDKIMKMKNNLINEINNTNHKAKTFKNNKIMDDYFMINQINK